MRASPWLAWSNAAAVVVLLTAAVAFSRSGSVLDTTPRGVLVRSGWALWSGLLRVGQLSRVVAPLTGRTGNQVAAVGRAAAIAVPILAIVVALLAAGDAVFAELLIPDFDPLPLVGHALLAGVLATSGLWAGLAASSDRSDRVRRGHFGTTEVVTMLGLAALVLALFVVSQLVAPTGAGRRLIESSGLTPAQYARSGFFQLCWATALIVILLAIVRALAGPEVVRRLPVRILGAAVPLLATGLVVVSLRRMALYDRAFGLTMLRLWVIGAAVWMGVLLVMIALRYAGLGRARNWVAAGALAAALALLLTADVANREAFVARHNMARARAGAELDVRYLAGLSDDAGPTVGLALVCHGHKEGAASLNLAVARADDLRHRLCPRQ